MIQKQVIGAVALAILCLSLSVPRAHAMGKKQSFSNCTPAEQSALIVASEEAQTRLAQVDLEIQEYLNKADSSARSVEDPGDPLINMTAAQKRISCIRNKLEKAHFHCDFSLPPCSESIFNGTTAAAFAIPLSKQIFWCKNTIEETTPERLVSLLVHEASHLCRARERDGGVATRPWSKDAQTYETWADKGFCIPKKYTWTIPAMPELGLDKDKKMVGYTCNN